MTALENGRRPPDITVVVPMHDSGEWIEETLKSVLAQTLSRTAFEIILVDDGSKDDSVAIATSVLETAPVEWRLIRTEKAGPSHARNLGWKAAKGSWIQFLDSDDLVHPEKLSVQLSGAQSPEAARAATVYSDWTTLTKTSSDWTASTEQKRPRVTHNAVEELLRSENFIPLGSALMNREWLERVGGFEEEYWYIEDVHLFLRLAIAGAEFIRVSTDFPVFYYRQRPGSLSQTSKLGFAEGCYRNAKLVEGVWRGQKAMTRERRMLLAAIYVASGQLAASASPASFARMLAGVERLLIAGPCLTAPGLRMLARVLGYRVLGRETASRLERICTRARRGLTFRERNLAT